MALLDDLLAQVGEPGLRRQLDVEVEKLRKRAKYGLVFERHRPEVTRLYGHAVKVGDLVQRREPTGSTIWRVRSVKAKRAVLEDSETLAEAETVPTSELVPVRRFGDPLYPGLEHLGSVHRGEAGRGSHVVICGENYDALQMLTFLHEGEVDAIYLDPPYNVGTRDWKYNNDYVDANDAYRHSKWLSMMERRLRLAERLLKPNGVLVVTIAEHEFTRLGVLLQQMFPTARVQMVAICITPAGSSGEGLSRVDEYAYFCFFGGAEPVPLPRDLMTDQDLAEASETITWESLLRRGSQWYRARRRNLCYPIILNDACDRIIGAGDPFDLDDEADRPLEIDGHKVAWPVRTDGRLGIWRVAAEKLMDYVSKSYAYVGGYDGDRNTWAIWYLLSGTIDSIEAGNHTVTGVGDKGQVLVDAGVVRTTVAKTIWKASRHIAGGSGGSQMLTSLLGDRDLFTYPKSVYAVLDTLATIVGDRPDALIVDAFGGSGTTAHATALLNSQDGGSRRCILITNNEVEQKTEERLTKAGHRPGDSAWSAEGVFQKVTRPRLQAAVSGCRPDGSPIPENLRYLGARQLQDGLDENVDFFELKYLDRDSVDLGTAFPSIAPLLWMKAGACGAIAGTTRKPWIAPANSRYAVLLQPKAWREFVEHVKAHDEIAHVFVVSDAEATYIQIREELPAHVRSTLLYQDYLRNFELNTERFA